MLKKKSILLIGLGKFGTHIAMYLHRIGHDVMAIDREEEPVNAVAEFVTDAQIGDATNEEFLRTLDVDEFDVCIVAIGENYQSSVETTYMLKQLGAHSIVTLARGDTQAEILRRSGADQVVFPERQLAKWLSVCYSSEHILDYIDLDADCSIFEVKVPKDWVGRSIAQIDIRKKYAVNIIAIKSGGTISAAVRPETVLTEDVTLLVLGEFRALQRCFDL